MIRQDEIADVETPSPLVITIGRLDWMSNLAWLKERRQQLLDELLEDATHLVAEHDCGEHGARVDALRIFDQRIAELELR